MIKTFRDKTSALLFMGHVPKRIPRDVAPRTKMRLDQIYRAAGIEDLRLPPSNRLEKLKGDRDGQWSIRVNDQWRVCFRFEDGDAYDVEVVDYH